MRRIFYVARSTASPFRLVFVLFFVLALVRSSPLTLSRRAPRSHYVDQHYCDPVSRIFAGHIPKDSDDPIARQTQRSKSQNEQRLFENHNPEQLSPIVNADKNRRVTCRASSDVVRLNLCPYWLYLIARIIKCALRNVAKIPRDSSPSILFGFTHPGSRLTLIRSSLFGRRIIKTIICIDLQTGFNTSEFCRGINTRVIASSYNYAS